jgi:glycosyltransferase involved in cell wall biosynthesis
LIPGQSHATGIAPLSGELAMRFHVLGIPHTISTPLYSSCAFTQKVVKLCKMLTDEGHHVIHYGHQDSKVSCAEHVTIVSARDLSQSYPGHHWRKQGWPQFSKNDLCYSRFYAGATAEIAIRKQPGDFLLCSFGDFHKPVADAHPDLIAVESGIGYPNGVFAKFRVFESYAIMHAYQGNAAAMHSSNDFWYDTVIPNAFDLDDFDFCNKKKDYLLFLGRLNSGKGLHIATQIAEATKTKLIVAGAGGVAVIADSKYVEYVGVVGPKKRRELLSDAKATICASTFLEPFCGVQIESMLSGTPVISSDWGAFGEYNIHGKTGFRCKTFEQFVWAASNTHTLNNCFCRSYGERFSLGQIAPHYTAYFESVADIFGGKGWYEPHDDRKSLRYTSFSAV